MKRFAAVAAVVVVTTFSFPASAELIGNSEGRYSNAITFQPIELFTGTMNIEYEHAFRQWFSLYGGLDFLAWRGVLAPGYDRSLVVGPEIGTRFYLFGNAPSGIWIGPYASAAYVNNTVNGNSYSSFGWGLGAMAGFNLLIKRFVFSLGAGTGWIDHSTNPSGTYRVGYYGFVPRLRLAIGVAF